MSTALEFRADPVVAFAGNDAAIELGEQSGPTSDDLPDKIQGISRRKRVFDVCLALALIPIVVPISLVVALMVLVIDGRPIFFNSERMNSPSRGFQLWKFRSMRDKQDDPFPVSSGHKKIHVTGLGRILRRFKLDELPQIWNVLKGDMSFVGPRPPLRIVVERRPEIYSKVLRNTPGITGLATLVYGPFEERIMGECDTTDGAEHTYLRRCVGPKARLDLIYRRNQSLWLDLKLIARTVAEILRIRRRK